MNDGATVFVQLGDERARVYVEGGIGFDHHMRGIGWVVNDTPSPMMGRLAVVMRNALCKHLEPIDLNAVCGCTEECCDQCDKTPEACHEWTVEEILAREG